jgi:hypothetical protein
MGKEDSEIIRAAGQHVFDLFRAANGDASLVYHGFKRTRELLDDVKDIAKGNKLDGAEGQVLQLSAWFHGAGHLSPNGGSREKSIELARTFLAQQGQPDSLVDAVVACLEGANGAPTSQGLAPDVLHDALLAPIARKSYIEEAELLRLEEEKRTGKSYSDVEWTQDRIDFLQKHSYRTRWAQLEYDGGRAKNLVRLHKRLRKQQEESRAQEAGGAKDAKSLGKVVESVFADLTRNQLKMLSIADRRTSTMIHVNAIMISLLVALVLRKLEEQSALLAPTVLLVAVNLTVIVVSVFSLRAGRRQLQTYPRDEIAAHDANPLIVTNEVDQSLHEYVERMNALTAQPAVLQRSMLEYVYFVRKMLIHRRKTLKLTYDIFIYGLGVALLFFTVVIARR